MSCACRGLRYCCHGGKSQQARALAERRQIARVSGIVIYLGAWHPANMQVQPLSVRAHLTSTSPHRCWAGLLWAGKVFRSQSMRSVVSHPRLASFQRFSTRRVNQGADQSPAAKALSGWRALTGATGRQSLSSLATLCVRRAQSAAQLTVSVWAWGSQASSGQWIRLRRARHLTVRARPAGAPQPGQFMQAGHARFVAVTQFQAVDRPITKGEGDRIGFEPPTSHLSDPWDLCECFGNRALPPYRMSLDEG